MQNTSVRAAHRYAGILFFGLKGKLFNKFAVLIRPCSDSDLNHISTKGFVQTLLNIVFDHLKPLCIQFF